MANDAISKTTSLITHATNEYKNKLEAVRQQRNELLNEIELIKISPLPLTDVIARVEAFVSSNNLITGLESFFYPYETNNRLLTVETIPDTAPVYVVNDMLATKFRSSVNLAGVGITSANRDNATDLRYIKNTTVMTAKAASAPVYSANQVILRRRVDYSGMGISNYWMGDSLTNAQVENMRTSFNTYTTAIGLIPFA